MTKVSRNFFKKPIMFVLFLSLILAFNPQKAQAESQIRLLIDGNPIELEIDNSIIYINRAAFVVDNPPIIKDGRALVPLRVIAEATGNIKVEWVGAKREVHLTRESEDQSDKYFIFNESLNKGITLGEAANELIERFGQPARKDKSEKGFTWYIYNTDLVNYFQLGVSEEAGIYKDKVIAFASNSPNWEYAGFKIGQGHGQVGNSTYSFDRGNYSINILPDTNKNNIVSTILVTNKSFDKNIYTDEVIQAMTLQFYDLANVYRLRNQVRPLEISPKLEELAQYHSSDMATNDFFSHDSPNGMTFRERGAKIWGTEHGLGENILVGYSNSILSLDGIYNSPGHRENMLNPRYQLTGVGIRLRTDKEAGSQTLYYTQNFSYPIRD